MLKGVLLAVWPTVLVSFVCCFCLLVFIFGACACLLIRITYLFNYLYYMYQVPTILALSSFDYRLQPYAGFVKCAVILLSRSLVRWHPGAILLDPHSRLLPVLFLPCLDFLHCFFRCAVCQLPARGPFGAVLIGADHRIQFSLHLHGVFGIQRRFRNSLQGLSLDYIEEQICARAMHVNRILYNFPIFEISIFTIFMMLFIIQFSRALLARPISRWIWNRLSDGELLRQWCVACDGVTNRLRGLVSGRHACSLNCCVSYIVI